MALEEFAAGPYALTYKKPGGSALALGLTEDGFEVQFNPRGQNIEESAEFGASLIDGVDRGHTAALFLKLLSWKKGVVSQAYWQRTSVGSPLLLANTSNPVGRLYSAYAGQIVATALANTPAAAIDAAIAGAPSVFGSTGTLTVSLCLLAPGQPVAFQMTSKLRTLPLAFLMLPYSDQVSPSGISGGAYNGNIIYGVAS